MSKVHTLVVSATLAVACTFLAPAVNATPGSQDLGRMIQQLENNANARGIQISDIKISRNVSAADVGRQQSSCTATATISIPGGTGVELSATAPTCGEAIRMLEEAINQYFFSLIR